MNTFLRLCNSLLVIILCSVLLAAFGVQYFWNERPCPLCLLQRLGMIGIATGALFNLRFGIANQHYALSLFYTVMGGGIALRQIALHICPNFTSFGEPVLGLSLYTWSFLVSVCSVLFVALMLLLSTGREDEKPPALNSLEKAVFLYAMVICAANIFSAWMLCGFGPCQDI